MNTLSNLLLPDREILLKDYEDDIQRRLDLIVGSTLGSFGAMDKINRFLVSEIAQLKLQVTELELAGFGQANDSDRLRPSIDHVWPSMPVYEAGSDISIGAGIMTFGFHFPEVGDAGAVRRWSGPSTRSGMVALINRAAPLVAEFSNITFIDPSVTIEQVLVDGEQAKPEWSNEGRLRFLIPPLQHSGGPVPTQIAFVVNKCLVVQDVNPQFADKRSVGFCTLGLTLVCHDSHES